MPNVVVTATPAATAPATRQNDDAAPHSEYYATLHEHKADHHIPMQLRCTGTSIVRGAPLSGNPRRWSCVMIRLTCEHLVMTCRISTCCSASTARPRRLGPQRACDVQRPCSEHSGSPGTCSAHRAQFTLNYDCRLAAMMCRKDIVQIPCPSYSTGFSSGCLRQARQTAMDLKRLITSCNH